MKRLAAVVIAGALVLAGCASGDDTEDISTTTVVTSTTLDTSVPAPVPEPVPEPVAIEHALPFTPEYDSFSFENFGGGEAPADLTVNMARRLYGDSQVCSDVTDSKCTPYPVILQLMSQANKSMRGGLCEGLAVLSMRLAGDLQTLQSFQGTDTVAKLIKEDPALLSEIAYWYVTQFAIEVQQEASAYLEMSPKELAEVLLYDFSESEAGRNHTGFTMGIYSQHGGHAVTPYKVEQVGGGYRIYIYDSNWPNSERWIDVDNEGWVYALAATNPTEEAEAWSGGTGTMELTPMSVRNGPFTCGFCPQEGSTKSGTLLTVAASGSKQMSLKIVTESGQRLGYYDDGFVNEIPGATYRYLISGPSTSDPVMVFLPPDVETFSADVEEIEVPAPDIYIETSPEFDSDLNEPEVSLEQEQEDSTPQKFSLLLLNEEKSVQIEATVEEPEPEPEVGEAVPEVQSLIAFSEESLDIAEIEEATVAIAIDALEIEVELDEGQQIAIEFAPEPVNADDPAPEMLDLEIQSSEGEVLAEIEVDVSLYAVDEPPQDVDIDSPIPEPTPQPVQIEITYDEVLNEVIQEEEEIEQWVASDAEYFLAVAEDRLDEVLGETWVEEIEEVDEWEPLFEEDGFDLTEVILNVDEEYWEDEQWEEIDYDEEWFEEQEQELLELFNETIELEEVFEFVEEIDIEEFWEWEEEWEEEDEWTDWEILDDWEEAPEIIEEELFEEGDWWDEPTETLESDEWLEEEWLEEEWPEEEWLEEELPPTTTWMDDWDEEELGPIPEDMLEWTDEEFELLETFLEEIPEEEELEVWEEDPFLDTEEEWDDWEEEFWPDDWEWEEEWTDEWVPEDEIPEEELEDPETLEEEWEEETEPEPEEPAWENPYEDCIGTSACENAPGGYDSWDDWEADNNPNYEPPEVGDPDYIPPPPPPVYVPTFWGYAEDVVTERFSNTSESTVTTVLARGEDGHWYETHTTETTTTTTTYTTNGTEQYSCVDNACATTGTTWGEETSSQTVAVTTATEVVPASCDQGGFTGLGDWCIVNSNSRNDHDWVAFSVPTAAEENEACDCTDGDGLMDIRIDAETNLTRAQFGQNNEWGDPYIYLNHDTDSDDGDHSGDRDAITVGNQITYNDDSGADCGNACSNPPSTATDPDETPNVTLSNGDPVIENVSDSWDSRITRELSAGDYVVRASVYNNANSGWYRLTIRDADVTYP